MGKIGKKQTDQFPLLTQFLSEISLALYSSALAKKLGGLMITLGEAQEKVKHQETRIKELEILIKGYSFLCPQVVEICPECNGAGAYLINGEVEECDRCDSYGWIEKPK